ncbi:cytosol aminopeptidase-like isoform X2 [Artemia franciscana]
MKFCRYLINRSFSRKFSSNSRESVKKGLVLGVYESESSSIGVELTHAAGLVNNQTENKLINLLHLSGPIKQGKCRVFHGICEEFPSIAVVGIGPKSLAYNELELVDEKKEAVRAAAAVGSKALREAGSRLVELDPCSDEEAVAEGASLALWEYEDFKEKKKHKPYVDLCLFGPSNGEASEQWERGLKLGSGQNLARWLMETPANHMTPTIFAKHALEMLGKSGIGVDVHDKAWAERNKMGSFLSVGRGSDEPSLFLELSYMAGEKNSKPVALVGKGVTFDSGGISIKPSAGMDAMRGDMGGAACTFAAIKTIASLNLPVNVKGFIPLCENMPSGKATKPGDVVTAMNGKTIQVDNTDAEGRLILADALCYAHTFNPKFIIDIATLTGAIDVALGSGATGAFTNSEELWRRFSCAGAKTGDRLWRMPLWNHFSRQVTESHLADINNVGKHGRSAGACTAAAFLKEFITCDHWMHLDIAGVMLNKDEVPYLCKGFSGRPTRTIVEFISQSIA